MIGASSRCVETPHGSQVGCPARALRTDSTKLAFPLGYLRVSATCRRCSRRRALTTIDVPHANARNRSPRVAFLPTSDVCLRSSTAQPGSAIGRFQSGRAPAGDSHGAPSSIPRAAPRVSVWPTTSVRAALPFIVGRDAPNAVRASVTNPSCDSSDPVAVPGPTRLQT